MSSRPIAFVLGDLNRDLFLRLDAFPRPGGDHAIRALRWALGGAAANTALLLARLGVRTGVIGRVGRDEHGRNVLRELARAGVRTGAVQRDAERPTGLCIVPITADGERTLLGARGANAALESDGLDEALAGARHLHVSGYALLEPGSRAAVRAAFEHARRRGATTSLDFGWLAARTAAEAVRDTLPLVDVVLPSAAELRLLFGERRLERAAARALELGVDQVAATQGAGGCRVFTRDGSFRVPPFPTVAVNTCGAGDAFDAGYVFGLLRGASPAAAAVIANAVGAAAVRAERIADAADPLEILDAGGPGGPRRPRWLTRALAEARSLLASTRRSHRRRKPP